MNTQIITKAGDTVEVYRSDQIQLYVSDGGASIDLTLTLSQAVQLAHVLSAFAAGVEDEEVQS